MIDVHCHLVYDVDDGSKNIEESNLMLKEAKQVGFTDIILTPHYREDYFTVPCDEIAKKIDEMEEQAKLIGVNLYQGNEIYATDQLIPLIQNEQAMALNNSKYVLFELSMRERPINTEQIIYSILQFGKVPIIAHPERYTYVQKNPNLLLDYIEMGVLFQSNYGSIIGQYGKEVKETVKLLLTHNMIHFLGSDNHRINSVYCHIKESMEQLKKLIGTEKIEELTNTNPKAILEDAIIEVPEPREVKKGIFGFKK